MRIDGVLGGAVGVHEIAFLRPLDGEFLRASFADCHEGELFGIRQQVRIERFDCRRHHDHHGDLMLVDGLDQSFRTQVEPVEHYQTRAIQESHESLSHRRIEAVGRVLRYAALGCDAIIVSLPRGKARNPSVFYHDALGTSRAARCVDQVSGIFGRDFAR